LDAAVLNAPGAVSQMRLSNVSQTLTDLCVVSAWSQQQSHFVSRVAQSTFRDVRFETTRETNVHPCTV